MNNIFNFVGYFFTCKGGVGRLEMWRIHLVYAIILAFVIFVYPKYLEVVAVVIGLSIISFRIRRAHDLDREWWYFLDIFTGRLETRR